MQKLIWILWPSFIVAGIAEILFFTAVDPQEWYVFGEALQLSRMATYSLGFFAFWAVCAASSMTTCFFQRTAADINRFPLPARQRPANRPKREGLRCCA